MCNMAVYVGPEAAAPKLIQLLQAQETLAGGHFSGIATLHEGKIYLAKVCGDTRRLLEKTDALQLPGTVGVAHSRTPGIPLDSWAQPFLSADGTTLYCANGIGPGTILPNSPDSLREMARRLPGLGLPLSTGVREELPSYIRMDGLTYHDTEMAGAIISYYHRTMPLVDAVKTFFGAHPSQIASLAMSVREPGQVLALRYNQSLFYGHKDGAYCVATSGTALQELGFPWIAPIPPASLSIIRQDGIRLAHMDAFLKQLQVAPDLGAVWRFLDGYFADGKGHSVIETCDELPRHPELDPQGLSCQDSFAVYSYLMERLRRGTLLKTYRQVPGSLPDSLRQEALFQNRPLDKR